MEYQRFLLKLFWLLTFLCWFGFQSIHAASCSAQTNYTCVATDYTLATCDQATNICDCKQGLKPIPSGCTKNLQQPMVQLEEGRINQFLPGSLVRLTCVTSDVGSLTFLWIKDGLPVHNGVDPVYEITGDDVDRAGRFSCLVKDVGLNLESDESTIVEIVPLDLLDNTVTPRVSPLPVFAAPGAELQLKCVDIPIGATYTFRINSSPTTAEVTQNSTHANISCVLDDAPGVTYRNKESPTVQWTTHDATGITSVKIVSTPIMMYADPVSVNLTCITDPDAKYLKVGNDTVKYNIALQLRGGGVFSINLRYHENTIMVNFSHGNSNNNNNNNNSSNNDNNNNDEVNITCIARYGYHQAESPFIRINFSASDVTVPVLRANEEDVQVGSRLVLTCGAPQQATYIWYKDGAQISRQHDHVIQFNNFQTSDAGNYTCVAIGTLYQASSQALTVRLKNTDTTVSSTASPTSSRDVSDTDTTVSSTASPISSRDVSDTDTTVSSTTSPTSRTSSSSSRTLKMRVERGERILNHVT